VENERMTVFDGRGWAAGMDHDSGVERRRAPKTIAVSFRAG